MVAELSALLDDPVDGVVLPNLAHGYAPGSDDDRVTGIVLGPLDGRGRLVVPVSGAMGTVSIGVVDAGEATTGLRSGLQRRCGGRRYRVL